MRFTDYFAYQARTRPDEACLRDCHRELTYLEAERESDRIAAALSTLPRQSRIAVLADNRIEYLLLDLAATKADMVLVPVNTRLIPQEWAIIIDHACAVLVFTADPYRERLEPLRSGRAGVRGWVSLDLHDDRDWTTFADFVAGAPVNPPGEDVPDTDIALQVYTSGTTGLPKGVVHSHRSMTISVTQWAQVVEPWDGLRGRCLIAAPLFHGATLIMWRTVVSWGGQVELQPRFDADAVLDAAVAGPISWTFLVPSMIHACLNRARTRPAANYQFNLVMYGGSPIAEVTLREAMAVLGRHYLQIYGLTESLLATILSPRDHERALATDPGLLRSAGRPIAGVSLEIIGGSGIPMAAGHPGEVVITCPNPMVGYWNNLAATKEMLSGQRLRSGDVGSLDDDGYLYIQDRVKDMIVTGGENVFSAEVEAVLHDHPAVADAAVIGVPDPYWGEAVTAVLVCAHGAHLDTDDVVAFCRERIAPYKTPKYVEVVDVLPRNSTGKLLKGQLRETFRRDQVRTPESPGITAN